MSKGKEMPIIEDLDDLLEWANSNIADSGINLVRKCEGLSRMQLINIIGWVLRESMGSSLGDQASWLKGSLLYQIDKAQADYQSFNS